MKRKLFYKIFAFTFGMMFLITVLAHVVNVNEYLSQVGTNI